MTPSLASALYLISSLCFILALRGLAHPESARLGNSLGMMGMAIAIATTFAMPHIQFSFLMMLALGLGALFGMVIAERIAMTALPQLVASFHSLVGLAAVLVAFAAFTNPSAYGILNANNELATSSLIEMSLGASIGAMTFTGSIIAALKLQGIVSGAPIIFRLTHFVNFLIIAAILAAIAFFSSNGTNAPFFIAIALSCLLGVTLIIPIGGADMPVVVSMLNSYSGWAAAGIGFTLDNHLLIITGSLVGSSGAILSYIMCKGMNRSFISVILGGFGGEGDNINTQTTKEDRPVKAGNADDAAFILQNAARIIIVPGYGLAVAQAQHAIQEMCEQLQKMDVKVRYAIHPVAGRMPGHMNVLLAEAQTPYDDVFELDDINKDFGATDVAFVIGANDITNPAAKNDPQSPIYGMPILDVERAQTVLFVKRSLGAGYAGIENELFFRDNTMMLFGDAKKMVEDILKAFN